MCIHPNKLEAYFVESLGISEHLKDKRNSRYIYTNCSLTIIYKNSPIIYIFFFILKEIKLWGQMCIYEWLLKFEWYFISVTRGGGCEIYCEGRTLLKKIIKKKIIGNILQEYCNTFSCIERLAGNTY